ncbi:MAG: glycosyltransferase [Eubacterium sp.]|nr:glycosyltransferase [Eubacterium sp.]
MGKKRKIAVYCDSMNNGGTEKATLDLVNNLPADKYDITVIQLEPGGKYQKQLAGNIKNKEILPFSPQKNFRFYWWSRRLYEKMPLGLVHKFVIGNKYDVEIGCGYGYPTRIIQKSKKAKKISWIHMDVSLDKNYVPSLTKEEGQEYFKNIDEFVCVSKDCAQKFNQKFGFDDKTKVCYNIVPGKDIQNQSLENTEIKLDKDKTNIVSIGRLTNQKGFDILIDAMKPIIEKNKNIKLYIVGEGEGHEDLSKQIERLSLEENIVLLGHVSNPYPVLKQADLYVCSSRHESFSLTVAESLILEVPVVSTRCTGPIELLDNGKYGLLTEHGSEDIQKAIELLIEDRDKLCYYKEMAKKRKKFFDVDNGVKEWEKVLDCILDEEKKIYGKRKNLYDKN